MLLSLVGVWKLISETEDAIMIFTARHMAVVFERAVTRRGFACTYTLEGTRLRLTVLVDTALNPLHGEVEVQIEGDLMTWTFVRPGRVSPTGRVEQWRRIE